MLVLIRFMMYFVMEARVDSFKVPCAKHKTWDIALGTSEKTNILFHLESTPY